jgi:hypothetical protein
MICEYRLFLDHSLIRSGRSHRGLKEAQSDLVLKYVDFLNPLLKD